MLLIIGVILFIEMRLETLNKAVEVIRLTVIELKNLTLWGMIL